MGKETRTPGQIAYEAFMQDQWGTPGSWFEGTTKRQKSAWEASAKAVLDSAGGLVDIGGLMDDDMDGPNA